MTWGKVCAHDGHANKGKKHAYFIACCIIHNETTNDEGLLPECLTSASQDVQKVDGPAGANEEARPLFAVRSASERHESKAGELFQHPARATQHQAKRMNTHG